jgi:hypothetical protein
MKHLRIASLYTVEHHKAEQESNEDNAATHNACSSFAEFIAQQTVYQKTSKR